MVQLKKLKMDSPEAILLGTTSLLFGSPFSVRNVDFAEDLLFALLKRKF